MKQLSSSIFSNFKLIVIVFVIIFSSTFLILYFTNDKVNIFKKQSSEILEKNRCEGEFFFYKDSRQKEFFKCGLIDEREKTRRYLSKLERVYLDEQENLVKIDVLIYRKNADKPETKTFVLGEKDKGYTFVSKHNEPRIFCEDSCDSETKQLNIETVEELNFFKNKLFVFRILNENQTAAGINLQDRNPVYRDDWAFRKGYFQECNSILDKNPNLETIQEKCGFVYINDLTFFNET